jgi:hypothetical protein
MTAAMWRLPQTADRQGEAYEEVVVPCASHVVVNELYKVRRDGRWLDLAPA